MARHTRPKLKSKHEAPSRMNASRAAGLEESIRKVERAQWKYLQQLEAQGKLQVVQRSSTEKPDLLLQSLGGKGEELETVKALKSQQEVPKMLTSISTNMWSSANPGYVLSATSPASASKAAHKVWQGAEAELLEAQRRMDQDHRRKKNDISEYVEASVSFQHMKKRGEDKKADHKA